jgi:hypothetical protein
MFLTPTDFLTGKYEISYGMYDEAKLIAFIERYEPTYLRNLFGVEMYNEFLGDLDANNVPLSPNFLKLYEPFAEDVTLYTQLESRGVLDMLKGFIYFEFCREQINLVTPYGAVKPNSENSTIVNTVFNTMYLKYNEALLTYKAIRDYIYLNSPKVTGQIVELELDVTGSNYITAENVTLSYATTPIYVGGLELYTQNTAGTGYTTATNVLLNGGAGTGCIVDILSDGLGGIASITIVEAGTGYNVGDLLTIDGGNLDATLTVDAVTYTSEIVTPPETGSEATANIIATPIDGVENAFTVDSGDGYEAIEYPTINTTGTGTGCIVEVSLIAPPLSGIASVNVIEAGIGYAVGDILAINGGDGLATIEVVGVGIGEITEVTINNGGTLYKVGDLLSIAGGNLDATALVTKVGVGSYENFNGVNKRFTYWI